MIGDESEWIHEMEKNCETTTKRTLLPACLQTLLVWLKAVSVSSTAAVPEARAAPGSGIIVPIEDKFGTGSFFFGKLADVHSCRERWEEKKQKKKKTLRMKNSHMHLINECVT